MTVFCNALGQTNGGISSITNASTTTGIAPTANGQFLTCTGANTFDFSSMVPFGGGGGLIQILNFPAPNPGGGFPMNVTVVGGTTSSYNAAAVFFSFSFSPLQTTSNIYATWNLDAGMPFPGAGNAVAWCGYLNAAGSPVISGYQGDFNTSSGSLFSGKAAALICSNISSAQTFSVCAFRGSNASTPTAPYDSAAVTIWEVSTNPVSPISVLVPGPTAVLCLNFPMQTNSSLVLECNWVAFNNTIVAGGTMGGNAGNFLLSAIRGSGDVELANNNVVQSPALPFTVAPYVYFLANNSTQSIQVYGVGVTGHNYNFNFNFITN